MEMEMLDPLEVSCDDKLYTKIEIISTDVKELKEIATKQNECINELKEFIQEQNQNIYRLLREQKQLLMQVAAVPKSENSLHATATVASVKKKPNITFPLRSEEDLNQIELELANEEKQSFYTTQISSLLNGNVRKNFKNIIAIDIVLQYNLDGTHGKKRFKQFKQLYQVVLAAIDSSYPNAPSSCDTQLRYAFATMKNRHFKNVSISNKNKKAKINELS